LDLTDTVPAGASDGLHLAESGELRIAPFLATAYYGINLRDGPLSRSTELRKALTMVIDRDRLVASLGFGQKGAFGFLPPGTWNYSPQSFDWKEYSRDELLLKARALYIQAGYGPQNPLRIRLLFNSNPVIRQTAILIAAMWKESLGVETTLTDEEFRVFLVSRRDSKRWDVARLGWVADYNDASNFLETLRKQSPNNDEGYNNPEFEKLLDQADSAGTLDERRQDMEQAEKLMLNDYPVIPLYFFVSKRLVKPYVRGVNPTPLDKVPTRTISIDLH
jgi:ABC-type oligopeptide transport system substrate-binding subunit